MGRNVFSGTIIILILSWYITFGFLHHDYDVKQTVIQDTVYSYTQIAAKKGVLYDSVLNEMEAKLSRFGYYQLFLKAEKFDGGASVPVVLTGPSIIGTDLRAAGYDLVSIYVIYDKPHPVSMMLKLPGFSSASANNYEAYLYGRSCLYIQ